jgi:hypothetical protein
VELLLLVDTLKLINSFFATSDVITRLKRIELQLPITCTGLRNDSESKVEVNGYESPESYRRKIKYNIDMRQIAEIISRSQKCEQFVKYECLNAGFGFSKPYSC